MIISSILDVEEQIINDFSCGKKELDSFFKKHALKNDCNGYGKTFVLIDNNRIIGFFTLCSSSIKYEEFPHDKTHLIPRHPISCIRIARLAVDEKYQGKGYGKELLKQAFLKILNASVTIGIRLIVVDAKESSTSFYEKFGFSKLSSNRLSYYLLLDTLKEALE